MSEIEIEAFKAGTAASKGITAADIAASAASFDPTAQRAPVVMGHPADDQSAPSFGEISGARVDGDKLFVKVKNLAQTAIDGVRNSQILNRSIAFWHPSHPSNPSPGKYAIRHLGLLGGSPPAIPGLAPLRFSAEDADTLIADGEAGEPLIFAPANEPQAIDVPAIAAAVAAILKPEEKKEFSVPLTEQELADREAALAERERIANERETKFAADEKARAEKDKADREAENVAFAAQLVADGKFPAGHKDDLASILNALPNEVLQFSGEKSEAPAAALRRILGGAEAQITFGVITPDGNPPKTDFSTGEAAALAARDAKLASKWK